jgi:hypothetical protein
MAKKEIITEIPKEVVTQEVVAKEVVKTEEVIVNGLKYEHQVGHPSRSFKTPIQNNG